jgi:exodeoxyribonuclease-3
MKIATFNINGINRRLSNLLHWLSQAKPDVVALQELKSETHLFPAATLREAGYHAVWAGQRTWNGVALLSRRRAPVFIRDRLPGDPADTQSRYIEAAIDGIVVASLYAPNGNPQPGPKLDYKLTWLARLQRHAATLIKRDVPVVLAGDFNIVPADRDIYPTTSWDDDALLHPKARAAFARLQKQGWQEAIRTLHPDAPMFTFWDYKRNRWPRDAGLRLDHLLVSPQIAGRLKAAGVDREVRGEEGASDHAPAWIKARPRRQPKRRTSRSGDTPDP